LRLEQVNAEAVPAGDVLAYLPPPQLARGCGGCDWLLVYKSRLLRRDCCAPGWLPVWSENCDPRLLQDAVAVAARGHRIAVSDAGARRIWMWARDGEKLVGSIKTGQLMQEPECDHPRGPNRIERPGPLAFASWGELLVADTGTNIIWRFGPAGESRGRLGIALPELAAGETIDRLAASDDCSIWIVTRAVDGSLRLWRAAKGDKEFEKTSVDELRKSFKPAGLTAADEEKGFCIEGCGPDGLPVPPCYAWDGTPLQEEIEPPPAPPRHERGELLTRAIDSGIPRCRWHRVRIDADIPSGTMLSIAVATSERALELRPEIKSRDEEWKCDPAGVPHPKDWQIAPPGALDFLIDQPPGRYLYMRFRFKRDQKNRNATTFVRRVRLDFPRVTSLDFLPTVYRDNPEAEDFTERFLSLFDASIGDLDRAIERAPALVDPEGVPDDVLPWLGSFLDLAFDPAWGPGLRRKVLAALPALYRRRGTIAGLVEAIKLITGIEQPVIQELTAERNWGSVGNNDGKPQQNPALLGAMRLFGRSQARFRLNSSALGKAPLRSYGNPDHDPLLAQVFRFRVLVPPQGLTSESSRRQLERLVTSQKPAHTLATIRIGGEGFILGNTSAVGVDTIFGSLPPPVLGKRGNVRLRRASLLWHGKQGSRKGLTLGETSVLGVQTIVE
ncbi:MAG TPA: phage tail protein, partial [Blastocatellia bacterium]